jgi:hypothetical protein
MKLQLRQRLRTWKCGCQEFAPQTMQFFSFGVDTGMGSALMMVSLF